jgi:hypothetical protein
MSGMFILAVIMTCQAPSPQAPFAAPPPPTVQQAAAPPIKSPPQASIPVLQPAATPPPVQQAAFTVPVQMTVNVPVLTVPVAAPTPAPPQAAPPMMAAPPYFAPASSQFTLQAAPFVYPMLPAAAPPMAAPPQSAFPGLGIAALTGLTVVADNPWIVDRFLGRVGACLHKRGMPVLRIPEPGTVATAAAVVAAPQPAAAVPVMAAVPMTLTAPSGQPVTLNVIQKTPSKTAFGRWFFGE